MATASMFLPQMSQDDERSGYAGSLDNNGNMVSPTTALFPDISNNPSASSLYQALAQQQQQGLTVPEGYTSGSLHPYLSRPPSLSPSSQSAQLYNSTSNYSTSNQGLSPHSLSSPNSTFSYSDPGANFDEMMLNNSYSSTDLDALLFQADILPPTSKDGQSQQQAFFLPQGNNFGQGQDLSQLGLSFDQSNELLKLVNGQSAANYQRRVSDASDVFSLASQPNSMTIQTPSLPPHAMHINNSMSDGESNASWRSAGAFSPNAMKFGLNTEQSFNPAIQIQEAPLKAVKGKAEKPATKASKKAKAKDEPSPDGTAPTVGKHNKTERRYRQKVQAAQADLRDCVPALRVLYGTSTEEQKQTTDILAEDGTVDGLGKITRPNASAKTTIFLGARMYIELLQDRVAMLNRKVDELESFRTLVAGEENVRAWRAEFDAKEAAIKAEKEVKIDEDSLDDESEAESEEEEPKRKKARVTKPKPATTSGAKKSAVAIRGFAAFAVSFSFLPSASTVLKATENTTFAREYVPATTTQIIKRLPLITAEHATRLLERNLPSAIVPHPQSLVNLVWHGLIAVVLVALVWPMFKRWTHGARGKIGQTHLGDIARDAVGVILRRGSSIDRSEVAIWTGLAAEIIGRARTASTFDRLHIALKLQRAPRTPHTLALLALLQSRLPFAPSAYTTWAAAASALSNSSPAPLRHVLSLSLDEARYALSLLPPTSSPITAIAEQVTLVHLNDLYSRFFVRLINSSVSGGQHVPNSLKSLLSNLEAKNMGKDLRASLFEKEIKEVISAAAPGTSALALGLVLIGLWGTMSGPTASAQAALASALAAEEVKGVGAALSSVSALRELLYPGSSTQMTKPTLQLQTLIPDNVKAIDQLAMVCIQYINLLVSTATLRRDEEMSRADRLARSKWVQRSVADIRLTITKTTFIGMAHEPISPREDEDMDFGLEQEGEEDRELELEDKADMDLQLAKERLVSVLSVIGRRATGRIAGRDEDSGFEGDSEDL